MFYPIAKRINTRRFNVQTNRIRFVSFYIIFSCMDVCRSPNWIKWYSTLCIPKFRHDAVVFFSNIAEFLTFFKSSLKFSLKEWEMEKKMRSVAIEYRAKTLTSRYFQLINLQKSKSWVFFEIHTKINAAHTLTCIGSDTKKFWWGATLKIEVGGRRVPSDKKP